MWTASFRLCSRGHDRKNWIFSNTPRGARANSITYSIVETAKENKPFAYLEYLFTRMPNVNTKDPEALAQLLPWSDTLPDSVRTPRR
ncbi:transposase domain-containing protein [Alicyclobacillus sp. ALC3]|nr:transposase domain-containing protein [Alicyclobacillus sp. ALC3]